MFAPNWNLAVQARRRADKSHAEHVEKIADCLLRTVCAIAGVELPPAEVKPESVGGIDWDRKAPLPR